MKRFLLPLIIASSLLLGGCAAGDWLRAPVTSADLVAAQQAHADAVNALEHARVIATRLDVEQAEKLIAAAERAVAVSAEAVARVQDDGTPRWLAGLSVLLGIAAAVTGGKAAAIAGTLRRVVEGVQTARRALPKEQREMVDGLLGAKQLKVDEERIKALKVKAHLESATV